MRISVTTVEIKCKLPYALFKEHSFGSEDIYLFTQGTASSDMYTGRYDHLHDVAGSSYGYLGRSCSPRYLCPSKTFA